MKKKRKKATSVLHLFSSQSCPFAIASSHLDQESGSAPDAPTRSDNNAEIHSCYEFAHKLFGKDEDWQTNVNFSNAGIYLRTFSKQLAEKTNVKWDTVQVDDCLYVNVPFGFISRDSFVALLDYAEEELSVSKVFVCLDRSNQGFGELVKAFRFMGFEHVTPDRHGNPSHANLISSFPRALHFLGYEFD